MKKLFLIPLLTLFTCVMVWGVDVANLSDLQTAVASANSSITLTADITMEPGTLNLNGATISCGANKLVFATENGTYTLQNGTFANGSNMSLGVLYITGNSATLNLESIVVNNTNETGVGVGASAMVIIDASSVFSCKTQDINLTAATSTVTLNNYGRIEGTGVCQNTDRTPCLGSTFNNYEGAYWKQRKAYRQNLSVTNAGLIEFYNGTQVRGTIHVTNSGTFSVTGTAKILANGTLHITNNGTATISSGQHGPGNLILDGTNNTTISGGTIYNTLNITINEGGEATISGGGFQGPTIVNNGTTTISGGTFNTNATIFNGTNNTLITGGTFEVAPEGTMGYIEPTSTNCIFTEGVGNLTIADGYVWRESNGLIVLESAIDVVRVTHTDNSTQMYDRLEDAFSNAQDGDEITLMKDANTASTIWIGTAGVNDAAKTLTLDLNGHSIISAEDIVQTFLLMHGALYVKNSVPGQGEIMNSNSSGKIFFVQGTYQIINNPRTAEISDLFTYLKIDEGVKLNATGNEGSSIVVDVVRNTSAGNNYLTKYYTTKAVNNGLANGVRVDVKGNLLANKYGIKVNGYVSYPNPSLYTRANNDTESTVAESDTVYSAFIHVYPSATITVPKDVQEAASIYTGGYGRMLVEGTCKGATGLYMKSGFVVLNNAAVESTWENNAVVVKGLESGIVAGGNAVVVESDAAGGYPGHAILIVNGDSKAQTSAIGGAALVDAVNETGNSTIDKVIINGGTFIGDYAIVISEQTASNADAEVVINGVSLVGEAEVAHETGVAAVNSILDLTAVHTTVVGNTLIVSKGSSAPTEITNFGNTDAPQTGDVVLLPERTNANWTGTAPGVINDGDEVVLGELQIISASGDDVQELTIQNNATLNVERLIMNENARIIVEAGGSLVVEGEQGINAPAAENIVLKASEEDQATFLINPEVTSNRHPMAQVQLISKAKYDTEHDKYIWQRFGIPAYMQGLTRGDMIYDNVAAPTAVYKLDYMNNQWAYMEDEDAFVPFRCYELTTTATTPGAVYTFECPLMGNGDAELKIEGKWNYYANSYSAPIDIAQIIEDYNRHYPNVSATVYLYRAEDNWWNEINNGNIGESGVPTQIAPMQAFIFQRLTEGENPQINYARQIWNPIMDPSANVDPTPAPLRAAASMKKTVIEITAADGTKDAIRLIEGDNFSNEFDNSYDAEKYMHTESFNLFADAENPMAILATDALVGTTLSMTTTAQTSFTMTFSNVRNMNYAIRDNLTGTETEIVEGGIYMFSVPDYATVDGRFEIVPIAQMPTTIENVEEKAAAKGIYTITGQFVGNNYHEIPNGIYVVDGKKIVK